MQNNYCNKYKIILTFQTFIKVQSLELFYNISKAEKTYNL